MGRKGRLGRWLASLACVSVLGGWLPAVPPCDAADFVERVDPAAIAWEFQNGDFKSATLTVVGPVGQMVRRTLSSREPIAFSVFDDAGNPRPDGRYQFELSLALPPDPAAPGVLRFSRRSGEFEIRAGTSPAPNCLSRLGCPTSRLRETALSAPSNRRWS